MSEVVPRVHVGGVTALFCFKPTEEDGPCVVTGGRDGGLKLCGPDFEPKVELNLRDPKFKAWRWAVKSVCVNKDGRKLLVGTAGAEVYELSATPEGVDLNGGPLVTGHCKRQVRCPPKSRTFFSARAFWPPTLL